MAEILGSGFKCTNPLCHEFGTLGYLFYMTGCATSTYGQVVNMSDARYLKRSVELGGSGIKKKRGGGGNDASLRSALFDSARVRGVLRCYDAIDRVGGPAVTFVATSSL